MLLCALPPSQYSGECLCICRISLHTRICRIRIDLHILTASALPPSRYSHSFIRVFSHIPSYSSAYILAAYTRRVFSRILRVFSAYSPRILVHLPRFGSNSNHITRPTPYDFPCFSSSTLTQAQTMTLIFAAYSRVFSAYSPIDGQFSTEIEMKPSNQHYVSTEIEMKPSNQHYV